MTDEQKNTESPQENEDQPEVAYGVHLVLMNDGNFAMQVTGSPTLGDVQMLVQRAHTELDARLVAETLIQLLSQRKSPIITPGQVSPHAN